MILVSAFTLPSRPFRLGREEGIGLRALRFAP
jgi:hypothetical protein